MRRLEGVDTVVATRYHTVLCALKLGKPTLAVGYAAKFDALMMEMGLAEFSLPAKSIEFDVLVDRFTELDGRAAYLADGSTERNAANTRLLNQQFAELSAALFGGRPARTALPRGSWRQRWMTCSVGTATVRRRAGPGCALLPERFLEPRESQVRRTALSDAEGGAHHHAARRGRTPSLLDIGCGPATLERLIPPTVRYHGIDIAIHEQAPNLIEADIVKSPIRFGDQKFDIVLAQGFFEYVGDYQSQKFDEIAQLLAPRRHIHRVVCEFRPPQARRLLALQQCAAHR